MHYTITFKTSKFDVINEIKNPINNICGYSLLKWLKDNFKNEIEITEPKAEDWGWYSYIKCNNNKYLIGASVDCDATLDKEWYFQIEKQRTLLEKIFKKEKNEDLDPCLLYFKSIFESNSDFKEIMLEK